MGDQEFKVLSRWWQSMFSGDEELKGKHIQPAPTSHKAELKRCNTADDAMLLEGFRALWMALLDNGLEETLPQMSKERQTQKIEAWATVAAVLVHIKKDTNEKLAIQAGKKTENDKSIVSELRFAKLQNTPTPEEFLKRIRRIIQQLDGKVSPIKVADDILQWFDEHYDRRPRKAGKRITVQWAMDYYRSAGQKISKSTLTN